MKKTIKTRIFTVNLLAVTLLLILTAVAFNLVARSYLEQDTLKQLNNISDRAEDAMQRRPPHLSRFINGSEMDVVESYVNLMVALRAPSSSINAEYAIIDNENNLITPFERFDKRPSTSEIEIIEKILSLNSSMNTDELSFSQGGFQYAAVLKPLEMASGEKAGKLIIYSSLDKINEMQNTINLILVAILIISALFVLILSNYLSKGISTPLSSLNSHIRNLSELNFSNTLHVPADNEIQELVQNINNMAQKLDTHNKSQKLFLQNASHEFRTPIMSIQSHAEGVLYGVVESQDAAQIIIDESKRLTHMVEELLYLSRLDAIEEVYNVERTDLKELLIDVYNRMASMSEWNNISLNMDLCKEDVFINGDTEKLERCFSNILTNCMRYAQSRVDVRLSILNDKIYVTIFDDGQGFEKDEETQIFNRFYKGKKGNTGLGLAISKSIIEKHHGSISAQNTDKGAKFIIELTASKD